MRTCFIALAFMISCVFTAASVRTAPAAASSFAQTPATPVHNFSRDTKIWVNNFDLDAGDVKTDKGGIIGEVRPGILERPRKRREHDPEYQAKKIVDLMAKSIVDDLQKAGYSAERLLPGAIQPTSGAWIRGVFTEVDEGNRMHRALFGFGSGEAKMELYVTLTDLAAPQKPLYEVTNNENSGKKLGAVITMNPYVAAAKFVMEKQATEKTVKKTASEIAKEVEGHLR